MKLKLLGNAKRGQVFIVSAPAGTGKTTLVQMLTEEFKCVVASISYTTRAARPGEIDGLHYHFISEKEFIERLENGEFLESVHLYGHYYGTSRLWLEEKLAQGYHVVLVIDTQGARQLKAKIAATLIFIAPPSFEELENRLIARQSDSSAGIEKRLAWAKEEILNQEFYHYEVINDDLTTAYQVLRSILIAEEHRIQ